MRTITAKSIAAFLKGSPFSRDNTEVHVRERPGEVCVELVLFGNTIARRWEVAVAVNGSNAWTEVTTAGWDTVTTRERLNGIPGVRVNRVKGDLFLNGEPWHGAWTQVTPPADAHPGARA